MKTKHQILSLLLLGAFTVSTTFAQDYKFKAGYPTRAATKKAYDDADYQRAITAYRFWYSAVSVEGIFHGGRVAGIKDNENLLIMSCGPRQVAFTPNSDTPYGAGRLDLSDGPCVIELPPGPFIGLLDDHYQGWVLDMGIPGPDAGKGRLFPHLRSGRAQLPTATDDLLGSEKWGIGPTGLLLWQKHGWTYGALVNHIWSIAGEDDRADINSTFIQPFINYTTKSHDVRFQHRVHLRLGE